VHLFYLAVKIHSQFSVQNQQTFTNNKVRTPELKAWSEYQANKPSNSPESGQVFDVIRSYSSLQNKKNAPFLL
jgi:hypothetical protein